MNQVVRFGRTNRKLNWEQEEALRSGKKQDRKRRDVRREGREAKWGSDADE